MSVMIIIKRHISPTQYYVKGQFTVVASLNTLCINPLLKCLYMF